MNETAAQREFDRIYGAESDAIFRFCLLRVSDREQALDLVQETFLRLWQSLIQGKDMAAYRPFLFTVARNLIIDWYRKKKSSSLEAISTNEETGEYEPFDDIGAPDLELSAEGRFVLDKIQELSPTNRQAIYLRFVEGMAPQEIAGILGISANAASVRVDRGLKELREKTGYSDSHLFS